MGSDSDASSGFEGLLERVGASRGVKKGVKKSEKAKGKEKAAVPVAEEVAPAAPPQDESSEPLQERVIQEEIEEEEEEDDDEGEVELVEREEGQPDPRDMLRAQLRRNESMGRQGKMCRTPSHTTASDERVGIDLSASPCSSIKSR